MTKEKLGQLIDLRQEIKEIKKRIGSERTGNPSESNIELLARRLKLAADLEKEIMEYINTVTDSRIRRIMQYKYVDGYTWQRIANIMHYDKSYPEKAITRYINKIVNYMLILELIICTVLKKIIG